MSAPTSAWLQELRAGLDGVEAAARDAPGIRSSWPRLVRLSRDALDHPEGEAALLTLQRHPVAAVARECPVTNWAWRRPRGYPGDARLTDFLYVHPSVADSLEGATERGRSIARCSTSSGLAEAARERRQLLADMVDEAVEQFDEAEVLAVEAQHLREAALARNAAQVARWVALDRDEESVDEIVAAHGDLPGLEARAQPNERILLQPREHGRFHLAYAVTAFEQLSDERASRLARALFETLRPGGRMLVASLTPDLPERGYMRAFMNWAPVLRDEAGLNAVTAAVPHAQCSRRIAWRGTNGCVAYALIERGPD